MEALQQITSPEMGDIFREYGQKYIGEHKPSAREIRVIRLLSKCRTGELGSHLMQCNNCGHIEICHNSCRNRHCPTCQYKDKEQWFDARKKELLQVGYFHIVFTIPSQLNDLTLQNKEIIYNILFKAARESLFQLARDPEHLGALTGAIAVLHTWGQNLMEHPHLHFMVPAGGLSRGGQHWIHSNPHYLFPVQVLSSLFRGKFCAFLKEAFLKDQLRFHGKIKSLQSKSGFNKLLSTLYGKDWVVFAKKPFHRPELVLEYISRYINRVALSNRKIIALKNDRVTILWKDYRDNKCKRMTLPVEEFIRRFLLHILPKGLCKIRYYGILANRNRKENILCCKDILDKEKSLQREEESQDGITHKEHAPGIWDELLSVILAKKTGSCPKCKKGQMVFYGLVKNGSTA
jgi:hypothetical protein